MAIKNSSILEDLKNLGNRNTAASSNAQQGEEARKTSDFWANIGYSVVNPDTGDDMFIGLPFGMAIDTMKPRDLPRTNGKMRQLRVAQNALLEKIQAAAAQLAPGESIILPLEIELRRNAEDEGITESDTALVKDLDLFPAK